MFYLLLAIICSSMIAIVMRISQNYIKGQMSMLSFNYLSCMILSVIYIGIHSIFIDNNSMTLTVGLGGINGIFYIGALVLSQINIKKNGVVLPSVFSRIGGLLVPLAIAIVFFSEMPNIYQIIGSIIAMVSIIGINYKKDSSSTNSIVSLLLLFFIDGLASAMSKVYGEIGSTALSDHFLLYTFLSAFILSIFVIIYKKEKPGLYELLFGIGVGIPNFFASRFLLLALNSVPAVIAYPIRSVGSIVFVAMAGLFMFHERLSKIQWVSFVAILVSVFLLNL